MGDPATVSTAARLSQTATAQTVITRLSAMSGRVRGVTVVVVLCPDAVDTHTLTDCVLQDTHASVNPVPSVDAAWTSLGRARVRREGEEDGEEDGHFGFA